MPDAVIFSLFKMLARAGRRVGVAWGRLSNRALSTVESISHDELDASIQPESTVLQSSKKRDRRLRYLVMQHSKEGVRAARAALDLLERSIFRRPIVELGNEGSAKFLKLPSASVCNKVINASAQEPDLVAQAAELADALSLQGVPLESRTLQSLLMGLARQGHVQEALPLLDMWLLQQAEALEEEENTRVPLQVLTALLEAAARSENTPLVLQVLTRMAGVGLMPTAQSMTSLLQCFARLGQHSVALSILDWMKRGGIEPNVISYTALLSMPQHVSDPGLQQLLGHARAVHARLQADGVQPNARYYTALLHVFGRCRDSAAVQQAWADLRAAGVEPDLILYSSMIDACAKCRHAEAALQVYEEMQAAGVTPDVVAYTALLSALHGSPAASSQARRVWASMQTAGVLPNGRAVAAYLDLLLSVGETDEALHLLTDAAALLGRQRGGAAAASGAVVIDLPRIYEHFIHVLANRGQFHLVEHLARHRKAARLPLTRGIASALLTAQALRHGHANAKWLLQEEEWQPEGSLEEQASIRARRQAAVLLPDAVVEACLLGRGSAEGMAQDLSSGSSRQQAGAPVSLTTVNVVLGGLAVRGLASQAFQLFDWMQQQPASLQPDWWTFRLLMFAALNAAQREQRFDLVLRVLGDSRRHARQQRSRGGRSSSHLWWDQKTRRAVLQVLQHSERAADLVGAAPGGSSDEQDARLAQLKALLSPRAA